MLAFRHDLGNLIVAFGKVSGGSNLVFNWFKLYTMRRILKKIILMAISKDGEHWLNGYR